MSSHDSLFPKSTIEVDHFPQRVGEGEVTGIPLGGFFPARPPQLRGVHRGFWGVLSTDAVFLPFRIEQQRRFCLASFDQARAYDCMFLTLSFKYDLAARAADAGSTNLFTTTTDN